MTMFTVADERRVLTSLRRIPVRPLVRALVRRSGAHRRLTITPWESTGEPPIDLSVLHGVEMVLRGVDPVTAEVVVYHRATSDVARLTGFLERITGVPVVALSARGVCDAETPRVAGPGSAVARPAFGEVGTVAAVIPSSAGTYVVSAAHVVAGGLGAFPGECLRLDGLNTVKLLRWSLPTLASPKIPDVGVGGPRATLTASTRWPDGVPYGGEGTFASAKVPLTVHPYRASGFSPIKVKRVKVNEPVLIDGLAHEGIVGVRTLSEAHQWFSGDSGAPVRDGKGRLVAMLIAHLEADRRVGVCVPWESVRAQINPWVSP